MPVHAPRLAAVAVLAAVASAAAAESPKPVTVVNGPSAPIPVQTQGTVPISGSVSVVNTPTVAVANVPSVSLAPGAAIEATQSGAWGVSIVPTPPPAAGTLTLLSATTSIGPTPIFGATFGLTASPASTSGAGASSTAFDALTVTRAVDASSPALFLAAAEGRPFASASVVLTDGSGAVVATLALENAIISSLHVSTGAGGVPVETLGLAFQRVTETVGTTSAVWDTVTNAAR